MTPWASVTGGGRPPCLGCCEIACIRCLGPRAQRGPRSVQPYGSCLAFGRSARRRVACVGRGSRKGVLRALRTPPAAAHTALGMRPSPADAPPVDLSPPPNTLLLQLPLGEQLQTLRGGRMCWANAQNLPEPPPGCSVITGFPSSASRLRSASSRAAGAGAGRLGPGRPLPAPWPLPASWSSQGDPGAGEDLAWPGDSAQHPPWRHFTHRHSGHTVGTQCVFRERMACATVGDTRFPPQASAVCAIKTRGGPEAAPSRLWDATGAWSGLPLAPFHCGLLGAPPASGPLRLLRPPPGALSQNSRFSPPPPCPHSGVASEGPPPPNPALRLLPASSFLRWGRHLVCLFICSLRGTQSRDIGFVLGCIPGARADLAHGGVALAPRESLALGAG